MTRKILIAFVVVIVIAGLLLLVIPSRGSSINQSYAVPNTFAASAAYGNDFLVFSNGRAFVDYNYVSGKTTLLSSDDAADGLSNIDSLSASPNRQFLLFEDASATPNGILYNQLSSAGLSPSADYWWVYNTATKHFQPLPLGIELARFAGNNITALTTTSNGSTITTYDPATVKSTTAINVVSCINFLPVQGGYVLLTVKGRALFTTNGVVSTPLASTDPSLTLTGVSSTGNALAATATDGTSADLLTLDIQTQLEKTIATNVNRPPVQGGDEVLYTTETQDNTNAPSAFGTYDLLSHKTTAWSLSGAAKSTDSSPLAPISLIGDTVAVVDNPQTN
jgi:hypothetical protein